MVGSTTSSTPPAEADLAAHCRDLAQRAQAAARSLTALPRGKRDEALEAIAQALAGATQELKQANAQDLEAGRAAGLSSAMLDRLTLTDARLAALVESVRQIALQPDPVGQVIEGRVLASGIRLQKVRVPIGVILIIFESRPNVTCDAAALCLKSGNAVILRGGKEARHSNAAIARCVRAGLEAAGLPADLVQLVDTPNRAAVGHLLQLEGLIDLCIPRGGESLIRAVAQQARIPVIKHYAGNCHLYIDHPCDEGMALEVCINAKTQRPGVCNAVETLLFHREAADGGLLARICQALAEKGVEIRGDARTCCLFPQAKPASEQDWFTEYLDKIVAVRVVDSLEQAIEHINRYGSQHTDAILTSRIDAADTFVQRVDSANVFVNCSTRFSDGGQ
ncbi:MAG TPA: glutamate-5-semialdehyde dehydrogenase, partial [Phycisphaeraceae bacterium]